MQFKVDEGYETLKGRIRQAARLLPSISLPDHFDIYCKTRRNSTFSKYTILNQADFKTIMEQSWNSAGDGGRSRFKPEVLFMSQVKLALLHQVFDVLHKVG
jgi:hypothetical protein